MTYPQLLVILSTKTGMSQDDWHKFFSCTKAQQQAIAQMYKDLVWVQNADVFADVLAVLTIGATIAGAVSGIGSAIEVLKAL